MQYFKYLLISTIFLALIFSCKKEEAVIPENELTSIIAEIYLADKCIDLNPDLKRMADTMAVYESIFGHYGYNADDFEQSVSYYLQKKSAFEKINTNAKNILLKRSDELAKLLKLEEEALRRWWVADSIDAISIYDLELYPYYRSIKWLVKQSDTIIINCVEPIITDTPSNPEWWANNITAPLKNNHPLLLQEYLIRKEIKERIKEREGKKEEVEDEARERLESEKDSSKSSNKGSKKSINNNLEPELTPVNKDLLKRDTTKETLHKKRAIPKVDARTGKKVINLN